MRDWKHDAEQYRDIDRAAREAAERRIHPDPELIPLTTIEALIDKHGLELVLGTVGFICRLKADHIRENWQDGLTASAWDMAAKSIERAEMVARSSRSFT